MYQYLYMYPQQTNLWGYIGMAQSISLSVCLSKCLVSTTSLKVIMMKLYTVDLYNLRIAIKEYNLCPKYIKGDNKKCGTEDMLL